MSVVVLPVAGARFGRLVLTGQHRVERRLFAECVCDCGSVTWPVLSAVKSGKTRSCGCLGAAARLSAVRSRRRRVLELLEDGHVPEPNTGCWLWTKAHKKNSLRLTGGVAYGSLRVNGVSSVAHRVAYETWVGPIPAGLWVLHRCDTPACINPSHLFLGDAQANSDDMGAKGRRVVFRGGTHPRGHLSDEQVIELRRMGMAKAVKLADDLGTDREAITRAVSGRTYRHLNSIEAPRPVRKLQKVSGETVDALLRDWASGGVTQAELCRRYGISPSHVNRFVHGRSRRAQKVAS